MNLELPLSPSAELFPFAYTLEERYDLEHYLRPYHDDPDGELTAWARQFIRTDGPTGTRDLLVAMNQHIRDNFRYAARDEEGTQKPLETLEARQRLVPRLRAADDGGRRAASASRRASSPATCTTRRSTAASDGGTVGAGYTHAWLQAYLPGAGWVPFDPTNNLLGGTPADPRRHRPRSVAGGADLGQLVRRERRLPRHDRQRDGAARADAR